MKRMDSILLVLALGTVTALAGCNAKPASNAADAGASASGGAPAAAAGGVAATSAYDAGPRAGEGAIDAAAAKAGEEVFKTHGCPACHGFGQRLSGPDLKGVTMRRTAEWMENQILHPDVMTKSDPISHGLMATYALQMPNQGLTPEQAKQVIEWLKQRDKDGK